MFQNGPRGCDKQPDEEALGSVNLRSPWDPTWDLGLVGRAPAPWFLRLHSEHGMPASRGR